MSVQGTILVLDGVSTNRIMLKVQLTAAWYHVVQGERVAGLAALLRRVRPDLVLTAQTLPDGTAADVKKVMAAEPALMDVPIVAITPQNDKAARLQALSDGLDDVLGYPFKDTLLLARVRSLLRTTADRQELTLKGESQSIGFGEPAQVLFAPPPIAQIAILTQSARTGTLWCKSLVNQTRHQLTSHTLPDLKGVLSGTTPDAIVVELGSKVTGRNLLADLRSRGATRNTVLIGVLPDDNPARAAEVLDRGADAVCMGGFHSDEIALRLETLIARKTRDDRLRATLRKDLAESLTDPLTGLHNRRYAMRALDRIAHQAPGSGHGFAVMLADLDHFKAINDRFGHAAGDLVLTDAARRLQAVIGEAGFVARIGGEEFMIGLPNATTEHALQQAERICECICGKPFQLPDHPTLIPVTISVGVKLCAPPEFARQDETDPVDRMMRSADKALYAAKKAGRNQVHIRQSAA
ncbi:response regulator receiver modulated diguanylate cyclase [Ruegeria halocynthiae]|uniref:diguanylate cyclase n=1 Tax=Ruegeria halocynthiae TaxID=985054 RepID=A0A1H2RNL1_9RHOB|nr:diguanylate cyclase [Ruegeria halocynthiae]SDW20770.1 response regulator receiver modulated diguanylate cyclase [Ruegeria halocynthiae]